MYKGNEKTLLLVSMASSLYANPLAYYYTLSIQNTNININNTSLTPIRTYECRCTSVAQ